MRNTRLTRTALLAAACLAAATVETAAADDRAADRAALTAAKVDVWRDLYRRRDADGLNEFLADAFITIGPGGEVSTKAQAVESLREDDWAMPADFQFRVEDIVFLSDKAAIVYGVGESTRRNDQNEPCRHSYRSSNTFVKEDRAWKPIFSHVSGVRCDPAG